MVCNDNVDNDNDLGKLLFAEAASLYMEESGGIMKLFSAEEAEDIESLKSEAMRRKPVRAYVIDIEDERYDIAAEPMPEMPKRGK